MALAQYTDTFWFPDGTLAANVAARVFLHSTNVLAPLWTDATGTVPLANPITLSSGGVLTFWAEEGVYWLHLDTEALEIAVGAAAQAASQQDITDAVAAHTAAVDPHADRAYADTTFLPLAGGTLAGPLLLADGGTAHGVDVDVAGVTRTVRWVADQPLNSIVLEDGTHGALTVSAGGVYAFDGYLSIDGPTASDLALTFLAPALSAGSWSPIAVTLGQSDGTGSVRMTRFALGAPSSIGTIVAGSVALPTGSLTVGATPGELRMQAALAAAAGTVTIRAGSWLGATRIA